MAKPKKVKNDKAYKISKLMIWPSRTIGLPNYSSVTLNAGMEIVFDNPVNFDSLEVKKALSDIRKVIRDEFKMQYAPYVSLKKE